MQIHRVELKNIGPHRDLSVELGSGLIGIIGSNGAGKSTLVNSIYAALTNDFSRFGGTKAEVITNNTIGHSYIRLSGEHHGRAFRLTRWLRPGKNELRIGDWEFTKANEVNEAVTSELNITKTVIDKYVFVDQWQMFSFLDETPSERAKAFQFLCGTESASQIHKVCSEYVARQKGTEVTDNSLELSQAIAEASQRMGDARQKGRAVEPQLLSEPAAEQLREVLQRAKRAAEAHTKLAELKASVQQLYARSSKVTDLVTKYTKQQRKAKTWLHGHEEAVASARSSLKLAEMYTKAAKAQAEITANLVKVTAEMLALKAQPVDKATYLPEAERKAAQQRCNSLRAMVESIEEAKTEGAVCKYCKQEISEKHRKQLQKELQAHRRDLEEVQSALTYSIQFDQEEQEMLREYHEKEQYLVSQQAQLELAEQFLAAHADYTEPKDSQRLIDKAEAAEQVIEAAEQKLRRLRKKVNKYARTRQTLRTRIEVREAEIAAGPAEVEVTRARRALDASVAASKQRSESLGAYREAKQSKQRAEAMLEQLKLRLAERVKIQKLLETIGRAGEIFHWNQLPKAVSQANLELLISDINANLELFNNPFTVQADSDLTFLVFFPGQSPVKAWQLSGGQKVILAIAFRAALDRVFGHDVGMMFLDEPTAGLDADNINYFHDAIQQLATTVGQDRQLVVITHVQELGAVFDQVVEIKKG